MTAPDAGAADVAVIYDHHPPRDDRHERQYSSRSPYYGPSIPSTRTGSTAGSPVPLPVLRPVPRRRRLTRRPASSATPSAPSTSAVVSPTVLLCFTHCVLIHVKLWITRRLLLRLQPLPLLAPLPRRPHRRHLRLRPRRPRALSLAALLLAALRRSKEGPDKGRVDRRRHPRKIPHDPHRALPPPPARAHALHHGHAARPRCAAARRRRPRGRLDDGRVAVPAHLTDLTDSRARPARRSPGRA
ncbi:hypothetical protein B0H14DRAFT_73163 [Mycena olivaceomarginata]|nr:hypothetical protein B0H14DRAFT_73163 [Mycena olivaceomarginata]